MRRLRITQALLVCEHPRYRDRDTREAAWTDLDLGAAWVDTERETAWPVDRGSVAVLALGAALVLSVDQETVLISAAFCQGMGAALREAVLDCRDETNEMVETRQHEIPWKSPAFGVEAVITYLEQRSPTYEYYNPLLKNRRHLLTDTHTMCNVSKQTRDDQFIARNSVRPCISASISCVIESSQNSRPKA